METQIRNVPDQIPEKIQKILVPVDYSDYSKNACRYAIKIAGESKAEILLLHAYYSPAFDLIEMAGSGQTQLELRADVISNLEENEKETIENFLEEIDTYLKASHVPKNKISYKILPGIAEDTILSLSEEYEPDLVVMGTRGKDKRANSLIGSVTEVVIKKIHFPVLTVPENYTFIGLENVRNLLYLTNFDESDFISIRKLMKFTKPLKLKIFCIHISDREEKWDMVKMNGLKDYFKTAYGQTPVECGYIINKNLLEEIDQFVREREIKIISLTTRRRNLINQLFKPSLTQKLFYNTSIPLLIFHT